MGRKDAGECLASVGMPVAGEIKGPLLQATSSAGGDSVCKREVRSAGITSFLRHAVGRIGDTFSKNFCLDWSLD